MIPSAINTNSLVSTPVSLQHDIMGLPCETPTMAMEPLACVIPAKEDEEVLHLCGHNFLCNYAKPGISLDQASIPGNITEYERNSRISWKPLCCAGRLFWHHFPLVEREPSGPRTMETRRLHSVAVCSVSLLLEINFSLGFSDNTGVSLLFTSFC